jgi:transcriptional regulator with XRE-family HTH domain
MIAKMISLDEVRKRALSKPEVLKEYEALRTEFQIAKMAIAMRKATKLTQREFADKIGIKQSQLARLETGKQLLRLDTLAALAAGAGYRVEVIIKPQDGKGEELPEIESLVLH